jgi:Domain of unknown function (DUF4160)
MPTISIFFGIVIQMYWRDHAPPHVHAFYQGFEALVEIETGEIIRGRLPPAAAVLVRSWVLARRDALRDNWRRGRERLPFEKVPGADVE